MKGNRRSLAFAQYDELFVVEFYSPMSQGRDMGHPPLAGTWQFVPPLQLEKALTRDTLSGQQFRVSRKGPTRNYFFDSSILTFFGLAKSVASKGISPYPG